MKKSTMAWSMAAYLFVVMLVFSAISILTTVNTVDIPDSGDGILDLTGVDFSSDVITIDPDSFFVYNNVFYTPEDFASGSVTQEGIWYGSEGASLGDYGTVRLELKLPPGEVYAIASRSTSYAQRLFINGKEYSPIGVTGESAETVIPKTKRYVEGFQPTEETTEIIIQYSNFVHADGGSLFHKDIGLLRNINQIEQLRTFRNAVIAGVLLTTMLFFFGLFLFFKKSRYLLWFSLACGFIALRGLLIDDKDLMLLLPNLDWYFAIRLEYLANCGAALFAVLYISSLFPGAVNRQAIWGFVVYCVANVLFICLAPPLIFTRFVSILFVGAYAAFGIYVLLAILINVMRKKLQTPLSRMEKILLLCGLGIFVSFSALEVYGHRAAWLFLGMDYPQVGMMVFLFINILVLALGFSRIEQKLDEVRQSEQEMEETNQMLERLDRLKTDFLSNVSHEMRTPLMVMSGYAQLTDWQIDAGSVDNDTQENLRIITREAQRLARLASGLLRVSADTVLERDAVPVASIFEHVAATSRPILTKKNNQLKSSVEDGLPVIQINRDMILQVLFNLVFNANRYTENGVISLSAQRTRDNEQHADSIAITVQDTGEGISPDLLPHVFERHTSGSDGSGLGLSICKEIVEVHGGSITIESTLGSGTRITFTMPLEVEEKNEANNTAV